MFNYYTGYHPGSFLPERVFLRWAMELPAQNTFERTAYVFLDIEHAKWKIEASAIWRKIANG